MWPTCPFTCFIGAGGSAQEQGSAGGSAVHRSRGGCTGSACEAPNIWPTVQRNRIPCAFLPGLVGESVLVRHLVFIVSHFQTLQLNCFERTFASVQGPCQDPRGPRSLESPQHIVPLDFLQCPGAMHFCLGPAHGGRTGSNPLSLKEDLPQLHISCTLLKTRCRRASSLE